jgi:hypothetical protein
MRHRNRSITIGYRWNGTGDAYGETDTDRRGESQPWAEWIAPGASRSAAYAPRTTPSRLWG